MDNQEGLEALSAEQREKELKRMGYQRRYNGAWSLQGTGDDKKNNPVEYAVFE